MRVLGYGDFNFVAPTSALGASIEGYSFGIREDAMLVNTVEPTVIPRPGTYPTFGLSVVGAMYVQGEFGYGPPGLLGIEIALQNLWKRLKSVDPNPRQLRVQLNSQIGTANFLTIPAVLLISQFSSTQVVNFKDSTFVCARPAFEAAGFSSISGAF